MSVMRRTYCGNMTCHRRCRDPVADRGTDDAAQRGVEAAGPRLRRLSGNQHHNAVTFTYGRFECRKRAAVRRLQRASVQVHDTIGRDIASRQLAVPASIKCGRRRETSNGGKWFRRWRRSYRLFCCHRRQRRLIGYRHFTTDVRRHAPPQRAFFRAEGARHRRAGRAYRAERGSGRHRARTYRPRSDVHHRLPPKRYPRGSHP